MEVQTRSDHREGKHLGIEIFPDVRSAYNAWLGGKGIWKISWYSDGKNYRFRHKMKRSKWNELSETKLCEMSDTYRLAEDADLFWVNQQITPPNLENLQKLYDPSSELFEHVCLAESIVGVFSDEEFSRLYNCV